MLCNFKINFQVKDESDIYRFKTFFTAVDCAVRRRRPKPDVLEGRRPAPDGPMASAEAIT